MSVQEEFRGPEGNADGETDGTSELLGRMVEEIVEEEVEAAVGRIDDGGIGRGGLETVAQNVAQEVLEPVFESLDDRDIDDKTVRTLFDID